MAVPTAGESKNERQKIIADYCQRMPESGNRTLARALFKKFPRWFDSLNAASCAVRNFRGRRGAGSKKVAEKRGTFKPTPPPALPKSSAKPWEPFVLDAQRIGVISDVHIPYHSEEALAIALDDLCSRKLDCLLINGDLLDYYQISRHSKAPDRPGPECELELCDEFLAHIRHRLPKARIVWKLGNHEERWESYLANNAPAIYNIAKFAWTVVAGVKEYGVEVVGEQRIIMAGKLPILHGHELPKGMSSPVNPARGAFMRALDRCLIGHHHRTSEHAERTMLGENIVTHSVGCLCDLTPEYCRISKWNHGFAYVGVAKDGTYEIENKKIVNGKVY